MTYVIINRTTKKILVQEEKHIFILTKNQFINQYKCDMCKVSIIDKDTLFTHTQEMLYKDLINIVRGL